MLILILSLAFILRIISINQSVWLDEAINILATKNNSLVEMITQYAIGDFHPPGYFIILWVWTKLFGISEVAVRIPSVLFGLLTIYVIYLIGDKLHSKTAGLLAAMFLAVNPLHIYYSQEARMYSLAALTVAFNFLLFIKLVKKEKISPVFLIISNLAVFASDYVSYLIFPSQFIFLLIFKQRQIIKDWILAFGVSVLLGSWWVPFFLKQLGVGTSLSSSLPEWKNVVGAFDLKAIPLTFVKFIIGRISHPDKIIYATLIIPTILFFSFLVYRGLKFTTSLSRNILIIWLVIPILLGIIFSLFIPIYSYFRLLFVLPAFLSLVALGVISFKAKVRYLVLGVVLLIEILCTSFYLFDSKFHREDWRGLVDYINTQSKETIVLFESSGTFSPFDYYANSSLKSFGALRNFPARRESDIVNLEEILENEREVYLINYLVEISDPQKFVAQKLSTLGYKVTETKDFPGVGFLYHYAK